MTSDQEILDVVDSQDNVISKAPRDYVHNHLLMHRSSHILLFNSRGELFLQKRSMNKDECPGSVGCLRLQVMWKQEKII